MQSFKEFLAEATTAPIELKDLIENYPTNYMKMIHTLWGGKRLTYKGQRFFDDGDLGPVYDGALAAVENTDSDTLEHHFQLTDDKGVIHETTASVSIHDKQEVYLGYNKNNNRLYIGFDVWLDNLDEVFDELADECGYEVEDLDEPNQNSYTSARQKAWKRFNDGNQGFLGMLFELTTNDGIHFEAELIMDMPGGFYSKNMYRSPMFKSLHLIDLRLD